MASTSMWSGLQVGTKKYPFVIPNATSYTRQVSDCDGFGEYSIRTRAEKGKLLSWSGKKQCGKYIQAEPTNTLQEDDDVN